MCNLYNMQTRRLLKTIHQIQNIPNETLDELTIRCTLYDLETYKQIIRTVLNSLKTPTGLTSSQIVCTSNPNISGDDLYKLLAFYQILYHITLCDVFM